MSTAYVTDRVSLSSLYISPLNPRQQSDDDGIDLLASSIVECGLIQPLAGIMDDDGRCGILDGGRRLRALTIAAKSRPDLDPVQVMLAPDAETAAIWATTANLAREDMGPVDEIMAYRKMSERGHAVAQIARAFAVTEAHVYRRLKQSELPALVLEALRERKLSMDQAGAFAISDDAELIATVLQSAILYDYSAHIIRSELKRNTVKGSHRKARYIGEEAYLAAGGTISRDLFEGEIYFNDSHLVDKLFAEKLERDADALRSHGWAWVEPRHETYVMIYNSPYTIVSGPQNRSPLSDTEQKRLEELLAKSTPLDEAEYSDFFSLNRYPTQQNVSDDIRSVSGIVAYVSDDGRLHLSGPYIRPEEAEPALEKGVVAQLDNRTTEAMGKPADKPKRPTFSNDVSADLAAINLHALQSAVCRNQSLALRLLAFQLCGKYSNRVLDIQTTTPGNFPSIQDGFTPNDDLSTPAQSNRRDSVHDEFSSFSDAHTDDEILRIIASSAARYINPKVSFYDAQAFWQNLSDSVNVQPRDHWTPTAEGFWLRMPAAYLDRVYAQLTGFAPDSDEMKAFSKQKKAPKATCLERLFNDEDYRSALKISQEQIDFILNDWMPEVE